jgi:Fur family ferric uptake transcriptional regulator
MRPDQKLNSAGLRATSPRLRVLEIFRRGGRLHLTVDEVLRLLADEGHSVAIATAYRVLNHLTDAGLLARTVLDANRTVYELASGATHHHLLCIGCGKVAEFSDPGFEAQQRAIAEAEGYVLGVQRLVLRGHCKDCRSSNKQARKVESSPSGHDYNQD